MIMRLRLPVLVLAFALPAAAAPPEMERELAGVVDLFYDMDFDKARAASDALAARHPRHPAGAFYRSVSTYQRWIAEGMRSTETFRAFELDGEAAEAAARAMMDSNPAEAHYYLGATLGFRARANVARRNFLRALPDGSAAVKHLKKALALDPALSDARLGMGMYHYFAARMPAGAKPFAYLLIGEGADRKLGLSELWSVAETTGIARMEARSVLAVILSKDEEADWDGAEKLLAELTARYPRNPVYRLRRAYVAERRGDFDAAVALADPDGKWISTLHPSVRAPARAWALYRAAESRLLQGRAAETAGWLAELDRLPHPRGMKDWVMLRRANLLDFQGKHREADALYGRIKDKTAAALAKRFRDERYPAGPKDAAPYFTGY
ncbi:MAG: TTC39/IML2 family protein [Elusimicrobia bacterium]|nr:TTC39/IML2 family protein [Elusimicrobiota bacterium]